MQFDVYHHLMTGMKLGPLFIQKPADNDTTLHQCLMSIVYAPFVMLDDVFPLVVLFESLFGLMETLHYKVEAFSQPATISGTGPISKWIQRIRGHQMTSTTVPKKIQSLFLFILYSF